MYALQLISEIINGQVTIEDIKFQLNNLNLDIEWPEDVVAPELSDPVTRVQFVSDFLSILREDASIICCSSMSFDVTEQNACGMFDISKKQKQASFQEIVVNEEKDLRMQEKIKMKEEYDAQSFSRFSIADLIPSTIRRKKWDDIPKVESPQESFLPQSKEHDSSSIVPHQMSVPDSTQEGILVPDIEQACSIDDSTQEEILVPDIEQISNFDLVIVLVDIYCLLLDFNYIPNLCTELSFLLGMLLVENSTNEENGETTLFQNVHDCMYFSMWVLFRNIDLLTVLNNSTRKLLIESGRLLEFSDDIIELLEVSEIDNRQLSPTPPPDFIAFQPDTDSRQNFSTDNSFNSFRKQRDDFYAIKSTWEKSHEMPDFSFKLSLTAKVKSLLNYGDMCNMFHLARLFRLQLVQSCFSYDEVEGIDTDLLSDCSSVDKLKFQCGASSKNTTTSHTTFSGHQEFFRDFIVVAASARPAFIQHLTDNIIHELLRLNEMVFTPSDIETGSEADEDKLLQYERCVGHAIILAKFLGLITFMPYYSSDDQMPAHIIESCSILRSSAKPPVDVLMFLKTAQQLNRLCITVPWVVHFLMTIDEVSAQIPYYCTTYSELCLIYRDLAVKDSCEKARKPWTTIMLKLLLGWLFDSQYFPKPLFWRLCVFENMDETTTPPHTHTQQHPHSIREGVDYMDVVDRRTLYRCCPHMADLELPVCDVDSGAKRVCMSTSQDKEVVDSSIYKGCSKTDDCVADDRLVDNFLHTQPVSTSHIIDTLTEYITSALIKHTVYVLMPKAKSNAIQKLNKLFSSGVANLSPEEVNQSYNLLKEQLKMASLIIGQEFIVDVQALCAQTIPKLCSQKLHLALLSVLPADTMPVKDLCLYIIAGKCLKRFDRWLELHVNDRSVVSHLTNIYCSKLVIAAKKKSEKMSRTISSEGRKVKHDNKAPSPDKAVENMRVVIDNALDYVNEIMWDIEEKACEAINEALASVKYRSDMTPALEALIYALSVDLLILLVAYSPKDITDNLIGEMVKLWTCPEISLLGPPPDVLQRLVSPRNVYVLLDSPNQQEHVWAALAKVIQLLVRMDVLSLDSVSCQFLSLFQHTWDNEHFMLFKLCLSKITEGIASSEEAGPLLSLLEDYFEEFHLEE